MLDTVDLASRFPDTARWVETRSMLLGRRAEVYGYRDHDGTHFLAVDRRAKLASVVGEPNARWPSRLNRVLALLTPGTDEDLELPGWHVEQATLYQLDGAPRCCRPDGAETRLVDVTALRSHAPADLYNELWNASRFSPVAATFVSGRPVSFCYGVPTETLWDVSIDTLEGFRGRGYAGLCVEFMISVMESRGKRPVWGALDSNMASQRLAAKLGFVPVDRINVYCPDDSD
jgi:hypothetical protein